MVAYEDPGDGQASVVEFDEAWNVVGGFEVAGVAPGDGIAWNHRTQTLVILDRDAGPPVLIEVTLSQPVGIGSGQGKLFIGDEIDVPNSGGVICIFKSPRPLD